MGILRRVKKLMYRNNPYFRRFFREVDLEKAVFCSFDLETTGLDVKKDEIISIGAVKVVNFKVDFSTTFYTLLRPQKEPARESVLIHGIREEELSGAPKAEEVLPQFLEYIKGTVLIGYFVAFDIAMLSKYTKRLFGFEVLNPFIDIRHLYKLDLKRRYLLNQVQEEKSLDEIAQELGIEVEKRHNALCDCLLSAFVFLYFLKSDINWKRAINF
ncbi:exonuclease domain-containing protein [Phorcysia thermohydrogeniphila]|uniref:DNA polymerase-3 subunit epsilon n=1 Tax=Phorcysia thermohydrogeniphila TaxID=936138 RepID=A0A4R1G7B0_9BACT|nr:exonuclease domain-containing protein [Phorcysia thermohydrogeniphila]TCK03408.1 DNA polymerase-3 subunit epsilon [Phorcysia thermohydrogeniphila]